MEKNLTEKGHQGSFPAEERVDLRYCVVGKGKHYHPVHDGITEPFHFGVQFQAIDIY